MIAYVRRPPSLCRLLVALTVTLVLLTGCATTHTRDRSSDGPHASGSVPGTVGPLVDQTTVVDLPTFPDPEGYDQVGLRGTRLTTGLSCRGAFRQSARLWRQEQAAIDVPAATRAPEPAVPGAVEQIRVCPHPAEYGRSAQRDLRAGSELLRVAVAAFGIADVPAPDVEGPLICSLEGDAYVLFVARTDIGTYLLHIPEDACSHHLDPVRALTARILP